LATDSDMASTGTGTSKPASRWTRRRVLTIALVAALVLVPVMIGTMVYTERPQFCPVCHEMGPYYDAWAVGPHADTSCVDCHVDPGVVNHGLHKFVAMKELWNHFTRVNLFPNYAVELPSARCVACHAKVKDTLGAKFSHSLHAEKAPCKDCHATSGHEVSLAALDKAGILKPAATEPPTPGGVTPSAAAGHVKVACQRCHDQAKMKCSLCHKATHEVKPGDCSDCHTTGTKFLFKHPEGANCSKCHKTPANHFTGECTTCHKSGGKTWTFTHPASTACASCHKPPAKHFGNTCATCHRVGVPFNKAVFRHAGNTGEHSYRSFACVKCHPKSYAAASCTCHGGKVPKGD
jgi:nitrate/TMAO reductase-like tetraheme cytochrome c subunit